MEKKKRAKYKKRSGSKKGTPFERLMAKEFSKWFSHGNNDNIFWRTSQSGGRATSRAKAGKDGRVQSSDLCAIDPMGEPLTRLMVIELKKGYSKKSIQDLMDKPSPDVEQEYGEWFKKAERDRARAGAMYWIVVHQRDRRRPLVFFPTRMCKAFGYDRAGTIFGYPSLEIIYINETRLEGVSAVPLDAFFSRIDPSAIIKLSQDKALVDD